MGRRRPRLTGMPLAAVAHPNGLWCADYKGEVLLRNQRDCYPLTISDYASRYLLACEALSTTQERYAFSVFERAFQASACRTPCARITACPSHRRTRSMA